MISFQANLFSQVIFTCPTPDSSYVTIDDLVTASLDFTVTDATCDIIYTIEGSTISFPYNFPIGTTTVTVTTGGNPPCLECDSHTDCAQYGDDRCIVAQCDPMTNTCKLVNICDSGPIELGTCSFDVTVFGNESLEPIATMGEWGVIILGILLSIFCIVAIKSRSLALDLSSSK